jgi:tetratricopeptide (TPR) repeat protein
MSLYDITPQGAKPVSVPMQAQDALTWGMRYYLSGDYANAEQCFIQVVQAEPENSHGWSSLGLIWQVSGHLDDALKCYMRALEINPANDGALVNLGFLHTTTGYTDHAVRCFERAIEINPANHKARTNLGYELLKRFEFARGWEMLESRFDAIPPHAVRRDYYPFPVWDGTFTDRLGVWPEQGLGDQVLYLTLISDLIGRDQPFVIECDRRLIPALQRTFPTHRHWFVPEDRLAQLGCAAHISMMSLAGILRPDVGSFAAQPKRALVADDSRVPPDFPISRPIAISWRSFKPAFLSDKTRQKSAELRHFAPLAELGSLVSVQYGSVNQELLDCPIAYDPPIDLFSDIEGVLALIDACEVVVTTSNVTAHLAGALGKKTYLIYRSAIEPFFYWTPHIGGSLWYPSVEIVTGESFNTWEKCIEEVKLRMLADGGR